MEYLTEWETGGECGDGSGGPYDHDYTDHLRSTRRNEDGTRYPCQWPGCERRVITGAWDEGSDYCVFHRDGGQTVHDYLGHTISKNEAGRWVPDLSPAKAYREGFDTPEAAMAVVHEYTRGETH